MGKKVTDGRDYLGDLAPLFAGINDDVLFGQVWSRETELTPRDRNLITVSALMAMGITDGSLTGHIRKALENGVHIIIVIKPEKAAKKMVFYY